MVWPFADVTRLAPAAFTVWPHAEMLEHTVRAQPAGFTLRFETPVGTAPAKLTVR